jgi:hypothetical protein
VSTAQEAGSPSQQPCSTDETVKAHGEVLEPSHTAGVRQSCVSNTAVFNSKAFLLSFCLSFFFFFKVKAMGAA